MCSENEFLQIQHFPTTFPRVYPLKEEFYSQMKFCMPLPLLESYNVQQHFKGSEKSCNKETGLTLLFSPGFLKPERMISQPACSVCSSVDYSGKLEYVIENCWLP